MPGKSFYADSTKAYNIEGATTSVDDVYLFFRNIKSQIPESNIILSKLSVDDKDGLIDIETTKEANYTFVLSNGQYNTVLAEESAPAPKKGEGEGEDEGAEVSEQNIRANIPQTKKVDIPQLPVLPSI